MLYFLRDPKVSSRTSNTSSSSNTYSIIVSPPSSSSFSSPVHTPSDFSSAHLSEPINSDVDFRNKISSSSFSSSSSATLFNPIIPSTHINSPLPSLSYSHRNIYNIRNLNNNICGGVINDIEKREFFSFLLYLYY
jgi:hypothetical protein